MTTNTPNLVVIHARGTVKAYGGLRIKKRILPVEGTRIFLCDLGNSPLNDPRGGGWYCIIRNGDLILEKVDEFTPQMMGLVAPKKRERRTPREAK